MMTNDKLVLSGLFALSALAGPISALALAPPPSPGKPILVISLSPAAVVSAAGGQVIGPVTTPIATLAKGDNNFLYKLRHSGAWAVLDGQWIASVCGFQDLKNDKEY